MEPEFLEYIKGDSCILEKEPLEKAAKSNELFAYLHNGFLALYRYQKRQR